MTRHLIHVGLPKAGATYLQRWFAAHPQLAYCQGGIAGFGGAHAVAASAARPEPQARWRVTSAEVLTAPRAHAGDGSVSLDYDRSGRLSMAEEQARACGILASLFPNASILIVTRGFRAATLSAYSQYVRTGGCEEMEDVLTTSRDFPWRYDRLIHIYRTAFGAENVIVLPFELLRDDTGRFLSELEARLDLDPFDFALPAANVSVSPVELAWYPAMTRAVRRWPLMPRRVARSYARMLFRRRLAPVAHLLQRLSPRRPVTIDLIGPEFLEQFRGTAELLRQEPLYRPYLGDYLL